MANTRTIRGVRASIPPGSVIGRPPGSPNRRGAAQIISATTLSQVMASSGSSSSGGTSGLGITQLTAEVTAGPGVGAQASIVKQALQLTGSPVSVFAGSLGQAVGSDWLTAYISNAPGAGVPGIALGPTTQIAQIVGLGTDTTAATFGYGQYGVVGAVRTTDMTVSDGQCFAMGAFAFSNGAARRSATSYFGIAVAYPGSGVTLGHEQDVVNKGGPADVINPYVFFPSSPVQLTANLWIASGSGTTTAAEYNIETPASVAMGILSNFDGTPANSGTPTFKTGICFQRTSLTGSTGIDGDTTITDAISIPRMGAINFWHFNAGLTAGVRAGSIYSAATSAATLPANIRFDNEAIIFESNNGTAAGIPSVLITAGVAPADSFITFTNYTAAGHVDIVGGSNSAAAVIMDYRALGFGGHNMWVNGTAYLTVTTNGIYGNTAAFILRSKATITGGGTTNVPTLTAGPVTGNPTKWLPYDDNGTTRYIPSW